MNTSSLLSDSPVELLGCEDLTIDARRMCERYVRHHRSSKGLLLDPQKIRIRKMKSSVITSARLLESRLNVGAGRNADHRAAFLTLTYARIEDWDPNDIKLFLTSVRNYLARRGFKFRYVWVAELQSRGAVHYHVVVYLPRLPGTSKFLRLPKPDKLGWWKKGSTNICWARRAVGYLTKYVSKSSELPAGFKFPKGLRLYGAGGLTKDDRVELRYWRAPFYARQALGSLADIRKVKGGYLDNFTGLFVKSPWMLVGFVDSRPFFVYIGLVT